MTETTGCYSQYVQLRWFNPKIKIKARISRCLAQVVKANCSKPHQECLPPTKSNVQTPKLGAPLSKINEKKQNLI